MSDGKTIVQSESTPVENIGATIVGGIRPFFVLASLSTIVGISYAIISAHHLTIWTAVLGPVIVSFISTVIWVTRSKWISLF